MASIVLSNTKAVRSCPYKISQFTGLGDYCSIKQQIVVPAVIKGEEFLADLNFDQILLVVNFL